MRALPHSLVALLLLLSPTILADPATVPFTDCFDEGSSTDQKLDVATVYAQVHQNEVWGAYLNLTVLGTTPKDIQGLAGNSSSLATLFTTTSVLTLNAWTNSSYFCDPLRPPSPLPAPNSTAGNTFCPIPAGPFAFSSTIPWGSNRALTTLDTRLRAVDSAGAELVCIEVLTTPLDPTPRSPYGRARIILWATAALAIAYFLVVGIARITSAWGRGISKRGIWARAQSAGFIVASAISGERLATSPALMRFSTPSMRDVIFHTQWCAVLSMVAVQWPQFAYALLTQTAWSTLSYNITLLPSASDKHWDPLSTLPYSPPANYADQLSDPSSPLFIDPSVPNVLFTLPPTAHNGIESFAYTLGVRPQDLFPNCLIVFLGIIGATIALSLLVWFIDSTASVIGGKFGAGPPRGMSGGFSLSRTRSPGFGSVSAKEMGGVESPVLPSSIGMDENKSLTGHMSSPSAPSLTGGRSRFALPLPSGTSSSGERGINSHRAWWRVRTDISSFHGSVLHGNLVRILVLFHLPVTVFSAYHMTLPRSVASAGSIALAALSFALFSLLVPTHLVLRVRFTSTNKLYDETRTLLSFGPLYNFYRHGSQMFAALLFATNIAFGVTIGAGQKSGTAQAIIILVVEVVSALVTSIWLPWGSGASMGLISFLFCVARIVVAVLLVILTPAISIGPGPGGWVAYGILIVLALVYLALVLMLIVKLMEAAVRIAGGVGFDRSRHVVDSGLLGACGLLGCCGTRKRSRRSRRHRQSKYAATVVPQGPQMPISGRDSDLSSYIPPAISGNDSTPGPKFPGSDSRKGSTHSGQPPSVLRPEYANRPYREDSEDEGYIMGAWQRFPHAGYSPVGDAPPPKPPANTSGFSRVGGGRAHIDTPYAIAAGTTQAFPSLGQQSAMGLTSPVFLEEEEEPTPSMSNVARQPEIGTLPPGAMHPAHVRTKSQSAIIEDAGGIYAVPVRPQPHAESSGGSGGSTLISRPPSKFALGPSGDDDDDDDDESTMPKKKAWFQFRRNRPSSSEGRTGAAAAEDSLAPPVDDAELGVLGSAAATPQSGRSFVVIRKTQGSMGRLNQAGSSSGPSTSGTSSGGRPPTR